MGSDPGLLLGNNSVKRCPSLLQSGDEVNHSSRSRDQGKAESHQHQFVFHGDLLFSVSAKVPEQGKDIRDRRHVLELSARRLRDDYAKGSRICPRMINALVNPLRAWPAPVESTRCGHLRIELDDGERAWNAAVVLRKFASGHNLRRNITARYPLHRAPAFGAYCGLRRGGAACALAHNRKHRLVRRGNHNLWPTESFSGAAVGRTGTDVTVVLPPRELRRLSDHDVALPRIRPRNDRKASGVSTAHGVCGAAADRLGIDVKQGRRH